MAKDFSLYLQTYLSPFLKLSISWGLGLEIKINELKSQKNSLDYLVQLLLSHRESMDSEKSQGPITHLVMVQPNWGQSLNRIYPLIPDSC